MTSIGRKWQPMANLIMSSKRRKKYQEIGVSVVSSSGNKPNNIGKNIKARRKRHGVAKSATYHAR